MSFRTAQKPWWPTMWMRTANLALAGAAFAKHSWLSQTKSHAPQVMVTCSP